MAIFDLLQMSKPKIVLLVIFLVALIPTYYSFSCFDGACNANSGLCSCGFSPLDFFVCFVWTYVAACLVVEVIKRIKKKH